jgi:hypothetical protein
MRCSLGYALHGNDEVAKCLAVEGPNECWKMAPSWRVNPPDRPERLTPDNPTERATPLPVHTAPHIVAIEESSDDAEAGPVSSSDIALADDELHQTDEFGDSNEATIDDASGHVHGANGFVELTIESEVIQITRRVATRIEPAPAASDEPTDTDQ